MVEVIVYKPSPCRLVFIHDKPQELRPRVYHLSHQTCAGLCVLYLFHFTKAIISPHLLHRPITCHINPIICHTYLLFVPITFIHQTYPFSFRPDTTPIPAYASCGLSCEGSRVASYCHQFTCQTPV